MNHWSDVRTVNIVSKDMDESDMYDEKYLRTFHYILKTNVPDDALRFDTETVVMKRFSILYLSDWTTFIDWICYQLKKIS